ncbi:hypothetical protein [Nocardia vinacea]|nr:hypothetical protein [Nocardia vinacea]
MPERNQLPQARQPLRSSAVGQILLAFSVTAAVGDGVMYRALAVCVR